MEAHKDTIYKDEKLFRAKKKQKVCPQDNKNVTGEYFSISGFQLRVFLNIKCDLFSIRIWIGMYT